MARTMGGRDFLGGIYLLGNPFQGEDFYCHTSCKSLPGGKDLLGEYPYSYTGRRMGCKMGPEEAPTCCI